MERKARAVPRGANPYNHRPAVLPVASGRSGTPRRLPPFYFKYTPPEGVVSIDRKKFFIMMIKILLNYDETSQDSQCIYPPIYGKISVAVRKYRID